MTAVLDLNHSHIHHLSGDDAALWRRAWVVPFAHTIPEEKRDPKSRRASATRPSPGQTILAWAVDGCLAWQREGLGEPQAVRKVAGYAPLR